MLECTILGCGSSGGVPLIGCRCEVCTSSNSRNKRQRASIYIETNHHSSVLVDASPDLRMQALQHNLSSIDALIITHAHADHCHGLDDIRSFNYHRNSAIPLYADGDTLDEIKARFAYAFTPHQSAYGWYKPAFDIHEIPHNEKEPVLLEVAGESCLFFRQYHGHMHSQGIRMGDFAYSTDVKQLSETAFEALQGVKVWVVDCLSLRPMPTHAHLELTLSWIERVQPQRAILTHMGHEIEYETVSAMLPEGVELAYDGMVLTI